MLEAINSVPDFRRDSKGNFRHSLCDIILLLIIARLAGCASRREVVAFAGRKHAQLKKLGILRNGIPSEPTLCRVENNVDPSEMERIAACIAEEAASLTKLGLLYGKSFDFGYPALSSVKSINRNEFPGNLNLPMYYMRKWVNEEILEEVIV